VTVERCDGIDHLLFCVDEHRLPKLVLSPRYPPQEVVHTTANSSPTHAHHEEPTNGTAAANLIDATDRPEPYDELYPGQYLMVTNFLCLVWSVEVTQCHLQRVCGCIVSFEQRGESPLYDATQVAKTAFLNALRQEEEVIRCCSFRIPEHLVEQLATGAISKPAQGFSLMRPSCTQPGSVRVGVCVRPCIHPCVCVYIRVVYVRMCTSEFVHPCA
jgi:hypothetical protein